MRQALLKVDKQGYETYLADGAMAEPQVATRGTDGGLRVNLLKRRSERTGSTAELNKNRARQLMQVESLEKRVLLTVVLSQPIGNQVFAQDSGAEQAFLPAVFIDNNGQSDLTFSATSTNPAVLTASVSSSTLTITPVAGQSGYARVQMIATGPAGDRMSNTFRVLIQAATARSLDVTLGAGGAPSISYTESTGASAVVSLSGPGSAVLHFGGDNLSQATTALNGSNEELESITLTDTTSATSLIVNGQKAGGRVASVGDVTASGSLGHLHSSNASLEGDVNVTGTLPDVNVDFAEGGTITIGSGAVAIIGKSFVDENFASTSPITGIKMLQWTNSDNVPEAFTAAYVRNISVKGNFTPGLQLSGVGAKGRTLGSAKIPGAIGGTWNITGASAPLIVGTTQSGWDATFAGLPSFTSHGDLIGHLTAPTLQSINVRGYIGGAVITLTAPGTDLKSLKATALSFSSINATGNIGSISVKLMQYTTVFAGVASGLLTTLPASDADFSAQASIKSITVRGGVTASSFIASSVSAWSVGNLVLAAITPDNNGFQYGIAGHSIKNLGLRSLGKQLSLRNVNDQSTVDAQIEAKKVSLGDMTIQIV